MIVKYHPCQSSITSRIAKIGTGRIPTPSLCVILRKSVIPTFVITTEIECADTLTKHTRILQIFIKGLVYLSHIFIR